MFMGLLHTKAAPLAPAPGTRTTMHIHTNCTYTATCPDLLSSGKGRPPVTYNYNK